MGTLYLVATPIGNLEDMSARAIRILQEATLIAAEDTRRTGALLSHFGIKSALTSYFEHNKIQKLDRILQALAEGDVALVSDAGTPAINDPGYELVQAALAAGFEARPIPGPSAPISALAVSGLPTDSFLYLGYLPHKSSERVKTLQGVVNQPYTLIFFETPHRVKQALKDIALTLGDRQLCIAREMTKLHEEFWRGTVSEAIRHMEAGEARGEFTLVIAGYRPLEKMIWSEEQMLEAIQAELKSERPSRDISARLSAHSGWNKKAIYNLINQSKS